MCGPFTRDARPAPAGLLAQIQAQAAQHHAQQQACEQAKYAVALEQQASYAYHQPTFEFAVPFSQPTEVKQVELEPIQDDAVFNWGLLDEQFGEFSAPQSGGALFDDCAVWNAPAPVVANQCEPWKVANVTKTSASLDAYNGEDAAVVKPELDSGNSSPKAEDYDDDISDEHELLDEGSQPYSERLPKDLLNHPCAATLLSAGIRIKGRTREELIEVAERIKKRRRASAARCRARKASHIHVLEDENTALKEENKRLKMRIAELSNGNSMDLNAFFNMAPANMAF